MILFATMSFALLIPPLTGILLTTAITGRQRAVFAIAGSGIGFGLSSCLYFLSRLWEIPCFALDLGTLGLSAGACRMWGNRERAIRKANKSNRGLATVFWTVALFEAGAFWLVSLGRPDGGWDAWAIYNLRARFLFRTGANWRDAFTPLLDWAHPDYPPLVPGAVARIWHYAGSELVFGPQALAFVFTFATLGVLAASIAMARDPRRGFLSGLFLLSTPLIIFGATQCSDIPVGFFFLCTLVFSVTGEPVLAGLSASLGAWTKNEGFLFLLVWVFARAIALSIEGREGRWREFMAMLAGATPVLLLVVWFKWALAPANVLFSGPKGHLVGRLIDLSRHKLVVSGFAQHGISLGTVLIPPMAVLVVSILLDRIRVPRRAFAWTPVLAVGMALAGDYFVYVLSFWPVPWLIDTSLDRVLMQICPSAVLAVFILPEKARTSGAASPSRLRLRLPKEGQ